MGGNRAFDEFFRAGLPRARRVAERIVGRAEADDAAAEAFARALASWRRVGRLPYREAWLLRVTANVAVDMARRRRPSVDVDVAGGLEGDAGLEESDRVADRVALAAALGLLAPRQREVVVLRFVAGLSVDQVAGALRISANTVKTHSSRGLDALRRVLGEEGEDVLGRVL